MARLKETACFSFGLRKAASCVFVKNGLFFFLTFLLKVFCSSGTGVSTCFSNDISLNSGIAASHAAWSETKG